MSKEELLTAIKSIVGSKTFTFNDKKTRTLGDAMRPYTAITKKYLYISCRITWGWNGDETEVGVYFRRYSLYRAFDGKNVTKVELKYLFTKDLQKIYDDIVFYLWCEKTIHLKKIEKEYNECLECCKMFDKLRLSNEDVEKLENS